MPKFELPLQLKINALDNDGAGFDTDFSKKLYAYFTAPGDEVLVKAIYRKGRKYYAWDFDIITKSPARIEPKDKHFGKAGGCSMQHIDYPEQIKFKQQKLKKFLNRDVNVRNSPQIDRYRNRMDIAITPQGIGFRERGRWWSIVEIDDCILFSERLKKSIDELKNFISKTQYSLRDPKTGEGFLRYMVVREGKFSNEYMITIVTSPGELDHDLSKYFTADSIYWSVTDSKSDLSEGTPYKFWKNEFLTENIDDTVYKIHPNSFFQSNSFQTSNILNEISKRIKGAKIQDAFSGIGTFGIYLAKRGFEIVGFDINPDSINLANINCKLNEVTADYKVSSDSDFRGFEKFDSVIVDPPRAGLHKNFKNLLLEHKPKQIIYVSCNPESLNQDLADLDGDYRIDYIEGFDMFPHTPHVEVLAVLDLK